MAGSYIAFPGLVTFAQYGVNAVQTAIAVFRLRNRARLKFHFGALRQLGRLQWSKHAAFIDCMDCLHVLPVPCRWP